MAEVNVSGSRGGRVPPSIRLPLLLAALLAAAPVRAADAPPGWEAAWDFLVQDVCVDGAGRVLAGATPLDGDGACPRRRKLEIGERLPYHKRDWPGAADRDARPGGYQASDSIPIRTSLGPAVLQTYDFGDPPRRFGRLDPGDGGQVAFFTAATAAFGITEDGGAGLQLFIGPGCAPVDGWVIVDRSFAFQPGGELLARITRRPNLCPDRLGYAYTRWWVQPVSYLTTTQGRPGRIKLQTLVSEHFGGQTLKDADHLERFQFTQPLGYTRWERWQNLAVRNRAEDRAQAGAMAASERCEAGLGPPAAESWVMVDCRQWTQIVPPDDPQGDPPGPWLDRLRDAPATRAILAP